MSSAAVQRSTPQQYVPQDHTGRDRFAAIPNQNATTSPATSRRAERGGANVGAPLSDSPHQRYASSPASVAAAHPTLSSTSLPAAALPIRTSSQNANLTSPTAASFDSQPNNTRSLNRHEPPLPRENSAIITHIVVDDPQTDIAREKARIAESRPHHSLTDALPDVTPRMGLGLVGEGGVPDVDRGAAAAMPSPPQQRSRQEHLKQQPSQRKEVRFGDYLLGQTLGEGEFGKVKMGWKKDSSVQVAIKLIRKESLAGNTTRLPKIYREIAILRELQHPNIVRLHEFVETERHMGIILEYASGGELFDYILNHRYLKDPAARRLFAQLVSGVGYLHKKGIVHRDLKLENLLLDRNRNIIITDFGFANTFNPNDELGGDVERKIGDKEFVRLQGLDAVRADGHRRGDLMQTSCGSPCYAAPELVVSDGLYTGRKVDVWSCGVILYAMLAGYLPFDDDPANPEGDNINLLYRYIVSTPLTFPEYVTPHARDLLRQILVPDPRRRADLFEVARHSWLSEYSHVVGFIGSTTRSDRDIAASAAQQDPQPALGRSASVREPNKRGPSAAIGSGSQRPNAPGSRDEAADARNQQRDAKRRTVQVEYVAPTPPSARTETSQHAAYAGSGRTRARLDSQVGPVEIPHSSPLASRGNSMSNTMGPPLSRPRDSNRPASESNTMGTYPMASTSRPNTGGGFPTPRLPSRGNSYSTPVAATPTNANAQGRFSQPKPGGGYIMANPQPGDAGTDVRPASQQNLGQFSKPPQQMPRSHKRSSTLGSIGDRLLGRSNSRRSSSQQPQETAVAAPTTEKKNRKYPPVSMRNNVAPQGDEAASRPSTDSRRPSFGFSRKSSDVQSSEKRHSRRFSFLPNNFSFSGLGGTRKDTPSEDGYSYGGRPASKGMAFGRGQSPAPSQSTNSSHPNGALYDIKREGSNEPTSAQWRSQQAASAPSNWDQRLDKALPQPPGPSEIPPAPFQRKQFRDDGYGGNLLNTEDESERFYTPDETVRMARQNSYGLGSDRAERYQHAQADGYDEYNGGFQQGVPQIRPSQRRFGDAYDQGHAGSSGGARRVMDFFRRRGKERSMS